MKEAVATREVNQFLAGERTKLQTEKSHIEKELEQERQNTDKRKLEISEVIKKVNNGCNHVLTGERTRLHVTFSFSVLIH